ncbi:MAG TPA: PKD domain-containing protein, partial [Bacteroidia bacterium]|nr:PKD domain-containing protein [Bacteroidia bacterium]
QINCGYSFDDFEVKNPYGIGNNAIASGCAYLYTTDGLVLQQRNLTTGAVNTSVNLPGGNNGHAGEDDAGPGNDNSGVAVDLQCGNVYAGSNNAVYIYDQNLNAITSVAAPGTVLDVKFGNSLVAACGYNGTSGFVMQFAAQTCPGLTITHTNGACKTLASATVATPTFCTGPYTYLWTPGGQTTQTATGLGTGVYTVTIGTATSCVTVTDTVTISSAGFVNVTAVSSGAACTGTATATATGGTAPYTYSWNSGQTTSVISAVPAGSYTCNVTDANGCIGQAFVTVNTSGPAVASTSTNVICFGGKTGSAALTVTGGTPGYTYKWTSGQTTSAVNGLAAGQYTCTVTDKGGCSDIVTINITQPPGIRDSLVSSVEDKCFGDKNGQLVIGTAGGANPLSYKWSNGETTTADTGLVAGPYVLTITDANGCVTSINEMVTQPTQITSTVTGQNMCSGQSATLNATAAGGSPGYTFSWNGVNGGSTYTVSPLVTTTYTLEVTDANGCKSAQAPITVIVNPTPNVLFVPDTIDGCYPLCVKFRDQTTVAGGTIANWHWTFGNGDTSNQQNPTDCYAKPGVYSVSLTATSNSGCVAHLLISNLITVYDHPHADFTDAPQPVNIMNPFVQFTDKTVDQYGIQNWFWTLGDATDSTSTNQNTAHTYQDTGTFCPTLVVTNIHQCTDSIEHCIIIEPLFTLYIPNAFTPNHDGNDDVFLPKGIYVCSFEMYIFDRWGQELFHTTDLYKGWDGKMGGSVIQEDTYVYLIYATDCETHSKHSYVGRVTLLK